MEHFLKVSASIRVSDYGQLLKLEQPDFHFVIMYPLTMRSLPSLNSPVWAQKSN
jgi:hypothetical protein